MSRVPIAKEPWAVDNSIHVRFRRVNEGETVIAELTGIPAVIEQRAQLIAAAPELLDALENLRAVAVRYLPDYNEHSEIQAADAAICRATGVSP